ncbi:YegS/Rv2252/BmrU family lipid kinase [Ruminococcaceae bacterium OttesenSCG-928-A16]|nr:YegS/Rv2252/BmrU family lipid kinase [Ruminococcaceae bacterium OttesenSCG-928-A16]
MLFVYNPNTGGGRLRGKLMQILCEFTAAGYLVTVHPTAAKGDALQFTSQHASAYDIVGCCGGDGTLNEVVNGLLQHEVPPVLGYIPGGTTNDFASSLNLPKTDMMAAAKRIVQPKKFFAFDVGMFDQRAFNYVAAFGAFTDVAYGTPQKFKNVLGYFAYILEGIQKLPTLHPWHAVITTDDGQTIEDDFIYGMVSNSTSVAGFSFTGQKKVRLDDGLFEAVLLRHPQNLGEFRELSAALVSHNITSPSLTALKVRSIVVSAPKPISWTLDGEFGGAYEQVEIKVRQRALKICI